MYLKKLYLNSLAASTGSDSANKITEGNNMTKELSNEMNLPKTVEELANELNVSEMTIRNTANKLGILMSPSTCTVQKSIHISSHGQDTGKTRTVHQVAFTKADADMISAELSMHHNLKDNTVVVDNTKEMIKDSAQSYLEDLCKDNPYLMIAIEQQKQLNEHKNQIDEIRDIATKALNKPQITVQYPTSGYKTTERTAMQYLSKKLHRMISYQELPEKKMFSRAWTDESGEHINNFKAYDIDDLDRII